MSENRRRKEKEQPMDFTFGHVMPQAVEMEKAVLGALMIEKDAYLEVSDLLRLKLMELHSSLMTSATSLQYLPISVS